MADGKTLEGMPVKDELRRLDASGGDLPPEDPEAPPRPDFGGGGPVYDRDDFADYLAGRARYWRRRERQWAHPAAVRRARLFAIRLEELSDRVGRGDAEEYGRREMAAVVYGAAADAWADRYRAHRDDDREDFALLAQELEKVARFALERLPLTVLGGP